jgi:flagellar motility protein MotE (MotC chaperone)
MPEFLWQSTSHHITKSKIGDLEMIKDYSEEKLVRAWAEATDAYFHLLSLEDNPYISEKRRKERIEDVARYEDRLKNLQEEMKIRGMMTEEEKPRLRRKYRKYLPSDVEISPHAIED